MSLALQGTMAGHAGRNPTIERPIVVKVSIDAALQSEISGQYDVRHSRYTVPRRGMSGQFGGHHVLRFSFLRHELSLAGLMAIVAERAGFSRGGIIVPFELRAVDAEGDSFTLHTEGDLLEAIESPASYVCFDDYGGMSPMNANIGSANLGRDPSKSLRLVAFLANQNPLEHEQHAIFRQRPMYGTFYGDLEIDRPDALGRDSHFLGREFSRYGNELHDNMVQTGMGQVERPSNMHYNGLSRHPYSRYRAEHSHEGGYHRESGMYSTAMGRFRPTAVQSSIGMPIDRLQSETFDVPHRHPNDYTVDLATGLQPGEDRFHSLEIPFHPLLNTVGGQPGERGVVSSMLRDIDEERARSESRPALISRHESSTSRGRDPRTGADVVRRSSTRVFSLEGSLAALGLGRIARSR